MMQFRFRPKGPVIHAHINGLDGLRYMPLEDKQRLAGLARALLDFTDGDLWRRMDVHARREELMLVLERAYRAGGEPGHG